MIAFIGISGSGKTTQAEILAKKLGCPHVTTGKVLRERLSGKLAGEVQAGQLVDDKIVMQMLSEEFTKLGADKNELILDGSPRSIEQAEWLVGAFRKGELKFTAFIHINATEGTVKQRLLARGRSDDIEDSIRTRFDEYQSRVVPVIGYLREQGFPVHEIDGEQSVERISANIEEVLRDELQT